MIEGEIESLKFFSDLCKRPYKRLVSLVNDLDGYGAEQKILRTYSSDQGLENNECH